MKVKKRNQRYLTIGQLSKNLGLKTYTLRYWESEVPHFQPLYVEGRRFYDDKQVRIAENLKVMIIQQGLTVKSASQSIKSMLSTKPKNSAENIKDELLDILSSLSEIVSFSSSKDSVV